MSVSSKDQEVDMARRHVVLVADQAEEFEAVVSAVRERGFEVEDVIEEIATLVGSAEEKELERIRRIHGVYSVEEEKNVQLPFPESQGPF